MRIAFRLLAAWWLRTPSHGSVPTATCCCHDHASGSLFTSQ